MPRLSTVFCGNGNKTDPNVSNVEALFKVHSILSVGEMSKLASISINLTSSQLDKLVNERKVEKLPGFPRRYRRL